MKIDKKFYKQNGYLILNDAISKSQIKKLKLNANQMIKDFNSGLDRRQSSNNIRRKHKDISKNGKIFCFEPVKENYDLLIENLKSNKISNVVPL